MISRTDKIRGVLIASRTSLTPAQVGAKIGEPDNLTQIKNYLNWMVKVGEATQDEYYKECPILKVDAIAYSSTTETKSPKPDKPAKAKPAPKAKPAKPAKKEVPAVSVKVGGTDPVIAQAVRAVLLMCGYSEQQVQAIELLRDEKNA
jgi:hypothetical protein